MPAQYLTDEFCREATAEAGKVTEYPDLKQPGLALRVSPADTKSWILRYRAAGKRPRIPLGDYPAVTPAKARAKARAILASNEKLRLPGPSLTRKAKPPSQAPRSSRRRPQTRSPP